MEDTETQISSAENQVQLLSNLDPKILKDARQQLTPRDRLIFFNQVFTNEMAKIEPEFNDDMFSEAGQVDNAARTELTTDGFARAYKDLFGRTLQTDQSAIAEQLLFYGEDKKPFTQLVASRILDLGLVLPKENKGLNATPLQQLEARTQ